MIQVGVFNTLQAQAGCDSMATLQFNNQPLVLLQIRCIDV